VREQDGPAHCAAGRANALRGPSIKESFEVDFPRPRDAVRLRETPRYAELFSRIWHSLGEEFIKGRAV
jgi:hypothetical protein